MIISHVENESTIYYRNLEGTVVHKLSKKLHGQWDVILVIITRSYRCR